jgi:hypothetical protein
MRFNPASVNPGAAMRVDERALRTFLIRALPKTTTVDTMWFSRSLGAGAESLPYPFMA